MSGFFQRLFGKDNKPAIARGPLGLHLNSGFTLDTLAFRLLEDELLIALPGEEFTEMGRDLPEGIEAAKLLVKYGYDALDVDVGSYDAWWWSHPPMYQEKGLYRAYAKLVKDAVDVPVITRIWRLHRWKTVTAISFRWDGRCWLTRIT